MGRHKCAACAYDLARREIADSVTTKGRMIMCHHGNVAPESILKSLGDNQGGSGRHKCVVCAYQEGRAAGRGVSSDAAWSPRLKSEAHSLEKVDRPEAPSAGEAASQAGDESDRNKLIGDLGEALVLEYEKDLLLAAGKPDLANQVTHVAVEEGDAAGYDIRSFDTNGEVKFVEVKTTVAGVSAPFYLTENERQFAADNASRYYIYRLFDLAAEVPSAKFFVAKGSPEGNFLLRPIVYRALPRPGDNNE